MPFKRGDQVKIVKDFYANEAFEIARKNNIDDYTGIGEITKTPSEDDDFLSKDDTGTIDMRDSYHVYLKVGPHRHANNTKKSEYITYLEESDLEKV